METTKVDIDALATRFLECTPPLDADGKRISIALYRLLAEGEPVLTGELATKVGLDETGVQELLRSLYSDVFAPGRSNGSRRGRGQKLLSLRSFLPLARGGQSVAREASRPSHPVVR